MVDPGRSVSKLRQWAEHLVTLLDDRFRIPGTDDKYFYVWLDAPVGYPASFRNLCDRRDDLDFDEY